MQQGWGHCLSIEKQPMELRGDKHSVPIKVPTKAEGDAEEVVIDVGAMRAAVHDDAPTRKAAGVAMPPDRAGAAARQAVPAERRCVQDVAVIVKGSLHNTCPAAIAFQS